MNKDEEAWREYISKNEWDAYWSKRSFRSGYNAGRASLRAENEALRDHLELFIKNTRASRAGDQSIWLDNWVLRTRALLEKS